MGGRDAKCRARASQPAGCETDSSRGGAIVGSAGNVNKAASSIGLIVDLHGAYRHDPVQRAQRNARLHTFLIGVS